MYENKKVAVLIAAAGSGKRMGGGISKQYRRLGDMPVLSRTVMAFDRHPLVDSVYIIGRQGELEYCQKEIVKPYGFLKVKAVIPGGKERQDSVLRGLQALKEEELILIHDGARPFIKEEVITAVIKTAQKRGAAVCAVPVKDTIKTASVAQRDEDGEETQYFTDTLDRSKLYQVQTPQGFSRDIIGEAFARAACENFYGTDDAVLVERTGKKVYLVIGDYDNIKITTREDMQTGLAILQSAQKKTVEKGEEGSVEYRMGTGYDVHRLVEGRRLVLGGVEIPWELGLLGHSDADVLAHAVMDALLGAAALRDIGYHFPDSDERYRGADSLELLREVAQLLDTHGFTPVNVDATIIAQKPRLAPYIPRMCESMAAILWPELSKEEAAGRINVKATTTEKLGFCGRGEGIEAQAAACIRTK